MSKKVFKYKATCIDTRCNVYSNQILQVGEVYDFYLGIHPNTEEMEVFKDGTYITSFLYESTTMNKVKDINRYFELIRDKNLKELGI